MRETFELTLPAHWACALINGDSVNPYCDDEAEAEEETFMSFCANELHDASCVAVGDESFFAKYHDARGYGVLADTCAVFTFQEA